VNEVYKKRTLKNFLWILWIIFLIIILVIVVKAETQLVTIEVKDQEVTLITNQTSDYTITVIGNTTQTYTWNINVPQNTIDYERIEDLFTQNISDELIKKMGNECNEQIDIAFISQQSYIQKTFLPNIEEMNVLRTEKASQENELTFCKGQNENLRMLLSNQNNTLDDAFKRVTKDNQVLTVGMVITLLFFGALIILYVRAKSKSPHSRW